MLNLFHPISMSERKVFVTTSDLQNNIKQYEYIIYDILYMEGDKLGFLSFKSRCGRTVDEIRLTPIRNILGMSWSVICGQKIHSHIFGSDDVIHR